MHLIVRANHLDTAQASFSVPKKHDQTGRQQSN
jgi:hypothetical protein